MKSPSKFNRRDLLKSMLGASATGALGSLGQLSLMSSAAAASSPAFSDYKALVCVFLYGGNDSFNMLLPTDSSGHSTYAGIRGNLAVSNNDLDLATVSSAGGDLNAGYLAGGAGNPYQDNGSEESAYLKGLYGLKDVIGAELGVNGVMPELAQLITDKRASVIANLGNLVSPVTRDEVKNKTADLPLFLFAHNHQQRALQTGQGNNLNDIGWAGRIADRWQGVNGDSPLGLNISYFGGDRMLIGHETGPLVINPNSPPRHLDMQNNPNWNSHVDRRALFKALAGQSGSSTSRVDFGLDRTPGTMDPFKNLYNQSLLKSLSIFDSLNETWGANEIEYTTKDSYGNDLFSVPDKDQLGFSDDISGSLIKQLEAVAKMIELGATNKFGPDYSRQVFMVRLGGFDTHGDQVTKHPKLLREISLALWKFQKALEEKGHADKAMTFTMSDFGRTMSNNGDGTDHAWGAHHIVMGGNGSDMAGTFKGGQLLGSLPDLSIDGPDDYSSKGRIIPGLAQDQLNATLCSWFGIDEALMSEILPNIGNFKQGSAVSSAYLDLIA